MFCNAFLQCFRGKLEDKQREVAWLQHNATALPLARPSPRNDLTASWIPEVEISEGRGPELVMIPLKTTNQNHER